MPGTSLHSGRPEAGPEWSRVTPQSDASAASDAAHNPDSAEIAMLTLPDALAMTLSVLES